MQYPKHIVYVTGIIENEQGEILMIKSSYRPGWEPPGGIVELGEDAITNSLGITITLRPARGLA